MRPMIHHRSPLIVLRCTARLLLLSGAGAVEAAPDDAPGWKLYACARCVLRLASVPGRRVFSAVLFESLLGRDAVPISSICPVM
ncbi:hypothetical protein A6456_30795 [Paraburkholderia tropica]|nr:hypothetical protein A6456_30795 [Paraburkholderia tropica]